MSTHPAPGAPDAPVAATAPVTDPVPRPLQQLVAVSGILFVIGVIATIALGGDQVPERDAALTEWTSYAQDNEESLRLSGIAMAFAVYWFFWFLGMLRSEIGRAETAARGFTRGGYVTLAGGIVAITGMALGVFLSAAAVSFQDSPPEIIRALTQIAGAPFGLAMIGFATMLLSVALLNPRIHALPGWLGWVALIAGTMFLLTFGTLLSEEYDNAFGAFFPLSFLGLAVFAVGASVVFLRRVPRAGPPA